MSDFKNGDYIRRTTPHEIYKIEGACDGFELVCKDTRGSLSYIQAGAVELVWRPKFKAGDVVCSVDGFVYTVLKPLFYYAERSIGYYLCVNKGKTIRMKLEVPENELEPYTEQDKMENTMLEGYSFFVLKKGCLKPAVMVLQMAATRLAESTSFTLPYPLKADGDFGPKTEKVIIEMQKYLGFTGDDVDGVVGSGTWSKLMPELGDWRPPLRLRLMVLQDGYENTNKKNTFGAVSWIKEEGWYNYGIFNVNWPKPWGVSLSGSSVGIMLKMAGRTDLYTHVESNPDPVAYFLGRTKEGKDVQMGPYFDKYVLGPALTHLANVGFDQFAIDPSNLPDRMDPDEERLLALSVDIAVNSGPGGFAPKRIPRLWDGNGVEKWDSALPDRDKCIAIFEEEFNDARTNDAPCTVVDPCIPYDYSVSTRSTYPKALKRCLEEVCSTTQEKVNLIADLQARCVPGRKLGNSTLRREIIKRRRTIARPEGWRFQGADYKLTKFGLG